MANSAPTPRFVGRRRELDDLSAHLAEAAAGRGRVVMIGGEPGLGKSHLLHHVARQAEEQGMAAVFASCREGDGVPPLWPWAQIVDILTAVELTSDGDLPGLLREGEPVQGLLGDVDPAGARFRLFDRVATCLCSAARQRTMLLVLDDLQWADRSSVHLLGHLSASVRSVPLVVAGAFRDIEPNQALTDLLTALPSDADRLTLTGLSSDEVAELAELVMRAPVEDELVASLTDHTAGNPLFVKELVRLWDAQGRLGRPTILPAGIRDVLDRRLARLSNDCHSALAAGSVIGREFDADLLAAALDREADALADVLDEALGARIIRETGLDRFGFVHDLFRQALYDGLGRTHRLRLHQAVGEAIEVRHADDLDARAGELAHHFAVVATVGDAAKAVDYGRRAAARAASVWAFDEAVDHLRGTLDVLPAGATADRARLLVALGNARSRAGDLDDARAVLVEAAEAARAVGDGETFAAAALGYGLGLGGYQPLASADTHLIALLEEALERLASDDSELRCRVLGRLAVELYLTDDLTRRSELSAEALAMARRLDHPSSLATALYARQIAVLGPDSFDERLAAANEILELAEQTRDRELVLWGHLFLHWAHMERCLPTDGDLAVCARLAEQLALPGYRAEVAMRQAVNALVAGRFEDAERLQAQAQAGAATDLAAASTRTALLSLEAALKGPYDDLAELVRVFIAEQPDKVMWRAALATVYTELGRLDEARQEFEALAERDFDVPRDGLWLTAMFSLGLACFALGDAARAEPLHRMVRPHADQAPVGAFGSMATTLGLLDGAAGRIDDALAWLELGHQRNLAVDNRAYAAFARRETAAVLLARDRPGDRETARTTLTEVLEELRGLGFDGFVGRAERLLAAAGEPEPAKPTPELRRDVGGWTVTFDGRTSHLAAAKGIDDLAVLLAQPHREVAALDLVGAVTATDTGELLDERARREIRARLRDLEEDIDEAEANGDLGQAETARAERDELVAQLTAALGLGGRVRHLGDVRERARKTVTWRIRRAIKAIDEAHPALGRHLDQTIRTGTFCVYGPATPLKWQIRPQADPD